MGVVSEYDLKYGSSICFSLSYFFKFIRGFDEFYRLWGTEDVDIIKRFELMGLEVKDISDRTSYIHQYHLKYAGQGEIKRVEELHIVNRDYFLENNSILRNPLGWGDLKICYSNPNLEKLNSQDIFLRARKLKSDLDFMKKDN